jgi:hypothetical protein
MGSENGGLADRLLKGDPGRCPDPAVAPKVELIINLNAAKVLGSIVPLALLTPTG